jgi:subtilisin family serine protease
MKAGFKVAVVITFLVGYNGGAYAAVTGAEGTDFAPGELIVKFNTEITLEYVEGIYLTGLPEIDAINEGIDVSYIEQVTPLPEEWIDDPTGYFTWDKYLTAYEDHGLGKIYYVEFDSEEATVAYVVNEYEGTGLVEYAHPNHYYELCEIIPDDEYYPNQWYLDDDYSGGIRANRGWTHETGDPSIRIGVLDSGISMPHPDLKDKIIWPWDCWELDDRPLDYNGHGTKVAGVAAAETNNDYDFYDPPETALGIGGTSWGSLIVPIKITIGNGSGWSTDDLYLNRGIDWSTTHHARIINMSFGGTHNSGSFHDHCNAAWDMGHLLIAAAGNEGTSEVLYPAGWAVVLAVSAIDFDAVIVREPKWWWGSSYGGHIELCAPGTYIKTTKKPPDYSVDPEDPQGPGYYYYDLYTDQGGYLSFNGTSAAAPIVSGVAALKWAQCPDWTNQEIRDYLNKSAWDLGDEGRDIYYGYGRVDAYRAVGPWSEPVQPPPGTSGDPGATASSLAVKDGSCEVRPYEVYPNPASSNLSFNVPPGSGVTDVKVYDVTGRVVFSATPPPTGGTLIWDLNDKDGSRVSAGLYLVNYAGTEGPTIEKVVVR